MLDLLPDSNCTVDVSANLLTSCCTTEGDGVGSAGSPKFMSVPQMNDAVGTPPQVPMIYCGAIVSPQPSFCNVSDISASASGYPVPTSVASSLTLVTITSILGAQAMATNGLRSAVTTDLARAGLPLHRLTIPIGVNE
ncbi:hypothetical protein MSG28_012493 [Choristoneura fumiferana]|uniref:Uncharacterized protein n=1 Tax=Choristoneura fumiferana TaxID=7141 RepID=A0ACC0KE00_CHOFU|nr:hypothetical protein MSG28_012493 [Choristoneura fumiferana]